MKREDLIVLVSEKIRLLRNEVHLSQDKMAELIGISKKTLVQIEKERLNASWSTVVTVCALFRKSDIWHMVLGDDPLHVIDALVFDDLLLPQKRTGGGRMFWKTIQKKGKFKVQKNILSHHYRLVDGHDLRWGSSFDKDKILEQLSALEGRDEHASENQ